MVYLVVLLVSNEAAFRNPLVVLYVLKVTSVQRPMAGVVWLAIAVALLRFFSKKIEISFLSDRPYTGQSNVSLIMLPYRSSARHSLETELKQGLADGRAREVLTDSQKTRLPKSPRSWPLTNASPDLASIPLDGREFHTSDTTQTATFAVRIEMRSENGLFSWRFYEACIETLAVGLYLYATFVLTSTLFLSGEEAIIYACVLILSMASVRLLSLVF